MMDICCLTKTCNECNFECGIEEALQFFYKNPTTRDGIATKCKKCVGLLAKTARKTGQRRELPVTTKITLEQMLKTHTERAKMNFFFPMAFKRFDFTEHGV